MLRSLCAKYQQVVYYNKDTAPTVELLENFEKLDSVGLVSVATVYDQGTKNMGMWNAMYVTPTNPMYITKSGHKVFLFADTPHLMKNMRNPLIDKGFIENGEAVTAGYFTRVTRYLQLS